MKYTINLNKENLEEAKAIIGTALTEAKEKLPIDQDLAVELGWTESDFVIEEMDGASGYARYPNILDIDFNSTTEK